MPIRKFIFAFFLLNIGISHAQTEKKIDNQSILWSRYYTIVNLNEKWSLHSEFDNRLFLKPQNVKIKKLKRITKSDSRGII